MQIEKRSPKGKLARKPIVGEIDLVGTSSSSLDLNGKRKNVSVNFKSYDYRVTLTRAEIEFFYNRLNGLD